MSVVFNDLPVVWDDKYGGPGYFAGTGDGIVTIDRDDGNGKVPIAREITCFNAQTLEVVRKVWSFDNGHYIVPNLSTDYQYLLILRDYNDEFAPFGYDFYTPETTLTYAEQQTLLAQWANP